MFAGENLCTVAVVKIWGGGDVCNGSKEMIFLVNRIMFIDFYVFLADNTVISGISGPLKIIYKNTKISFSIIMVTTHAISDKG